MHGWRVVAGLWLMAVASSAAPADAQTVQTRAAALVQDAGEYARLYGVQPDEALRRLYAQHASVPATDAIARRYRDRLAGISVQHRPDYRYVVYLTGDMPVADTRIRVAGSTIPVTFRTGALATRDRVVWAITNHQAAIRAAVSSPPSMGHDPRTGELVVIIGNATAERGGGAAALDARFEAMTGVPVQIRVLERTDVNLDLHGGGRLIGTSPDTGRRYKCTSGYPVTDGVRYGLTTAAHCLDVMAYHEPDGRSVPLDFVGQWGWGYHDVQIHTAPVAAPPPPPLIYTDTARTIERPVEGQRGKASTRAGDFLCHRGESSGYSCAEVELLDFAPAGDLCGGACLPTWVTVAGPSCKGGDSGGPVFSGTTAYGVVKGGSYRRDGSCAFYFYMSLDYLPVPWTLVTAVPPAVVRTRPPASRSGG